MDDNEGRPIDALTPRPYRPTILVDGVRRDGSFGLVNVFDLDDDSFRMYVLRELFRVELATQPADRVLLYEGPPRKVPYREPL